MRRTLFIFLICSIISSCAETTLEERESYETFKGEKVKVITFDSCEYVLINPEAIGTMLSHKGNCKFCKRRENCK